MLYTYNDFRKFVSCDRKINVAYDECKTYQQVTLYDLGVSLIPTNLVNSDTFCQRIAFTKALPSADLFCSPSINIFISKP